MYKTWVGSSSTVKFYFHLHSDVFPHAGGEREMELQLSWWAFCITCSLLDLTDMPLIIMEITRSCNLWQGLPYFCEHF